jgi:hypothetical protein
MNAERVPTADSPAKQKGRALHIESEDVVAAAFAQAPSRAGYPGALVTLTT